MRDILLRQIRCQPISIRNRRSVALAEIEQERQHALAGVRTEQRFNPQRDPALLIEQILHQVGSQIGS